ncbi:MAG: hypothetical protein GY800_01940 [Planctomycetes bacterium]|nr:hypothetical protein [Planctomycetota bacterium]
MVALRERKGKFIEFFTKTPAGICCPHFWYLKWANGCPYKCEYCYLLGTFRYLPEPVIFSNLDTDMMKEVKAWLLQHTEPKILVTGELADSLVYDKKVGLTKLLIPVFQDPAFNPYGHRVYFLTKSTCIDNILSLNPSHHAIITFSVNAMPAWTAYEHGTPSPRERLAAARALSEAGWPVRIRLDPMLPVPGWEDAYAETAEEICALKTLENVTIGSLRFFPILKRFARDGSDLFSFGRDHHDPDRRRRIPADTRLKMYQSALDTFRSLRPDIPVGLCKEVESMFPRLSLPLPQKNCACI